MRPLFALLCCLAACTAPLADDGTSASAVGDAPTAPTYAGMPRVYFLTGFPINFPLFSSLPLTSDFDTLRAYLTANDPNVPFIVQHKSTWDAICAELDGLADSDQPARLVVIGHSYGGGGAVDLSDCLGTRPVDRLITLDTWQNTQPADVIPDNVVANDNFYQLGPLGGLNQDNHRAMGDRYRGITNTHVDVFGHFALVDKLVADGTIQDLIAATLTTGR